MTGRPAERANGDGFRIKFRVRPVRAAGAENRLALDASVPGGLEEWNVNGGVPENDDEEWQNVVVVNRNTDSGKVNLNANWRSNDNPDYSVPSLGSSHQGKGVPLKRSFMLSDGLHPSSEHLACIHQLRLRFEILNVRNALAVFTQSYE